MSEQTTTMEAVFDASVAANESAPVSDVTPSEGGTPENTPTPVSLADDALVALKIGGQEVLKPWSEARTGFMLHGDYTRKQQEFAKQREAFEAERAAMTEMKAQVEAHQGRLQSIFSDPQKMAALVLAAQARNAQATSETPPPQAQQPPAFDPSQAQALIQHEVTRILAEREQIAQRTATESQLESEFTTFTQGLLKDAPVLSKIPGVDRLLFDEVAKMKPTSVDEAKGFISTIVDGWKRDISGEVTTLASANALQRAKAASAVEPRGGAPVVQTPKRFKDITEKDMVSFLTTLGV